MGTYNKISPDKIAEVKKLLANNHNSLREIAKAAKVSYYTVYRIKTGCYDSGGLRIPKVKTKSKFFNVDKKSWIV